jgi:uncharacterized protein (TIGR00255 family)
MTGFGKANCELTNKFVTIEIKTLNSKQLDIFMRLPNIYKEKELELRNLISQYLVRGKIDFSITYEITDTSSSAKINLPLVKEYYFQLKELVDTLEIHEKESLLQTIMRFPDALKIDKEELDLEEWNVVVQRTEDALRNINEFRKQEGKALQEDILNRVNNLMVLLNDIIKYEAERSDRMREKLSTSLNGFLEYEKIDANRFEQELIYYLEKMDITEEKVRLKNHCDFFIRTVLEEEINGKKLSFIAQEMGREINTLGSKANHSDIQRVVVAMKDELEKIKEQLMNVL